MSPHALCHWPGCLRLQEICVFTMWKVIKKKSHCDHIGIFMCVLNLAPVHFMCWPHVYFTFLFCLFSLSKQLHFHFHSLISTFGSDQTAIKDSPGHLLDPVHHHGVSLLEEFSFVFCFFKKQSVIFKQAPLSFIAYSANVA